MTNKFSFQLAILSLAVLITGSQPALSSDRKIISSSICQAMTHNGAQHLRHRGSSLEALDVDVTVICPIIKDNHGPLEWVEVRHLRPSGAQGEVVTGRVFSCGSTYRGCSETDYATTSSSNEFTSVIIWADGLPSGDDRYYYYRSVLPAGWKIVSFEYSQY